MQGHQGEPNARFRGANGHEMGPGAPRECCITRLGVGGQCCTVQRTWCEQEGGFVDFRGGDSVHVNRHAVSAYRTCYLRARRVACRDCRAAHELVRPSELLLCHGCCCRRRRRHRNQHRLRRCLRCCCHRRRRRRRRCYSGCCWSSRGVGPPRAAPTCIMKRLPMAPGEGGTRGVISHSLTTRDPSQWGVKAAPQRLSQAAVPSTTHRKALPATLPITPSSGACTRPFRA